MGKGSIPRIGLYREVPLERGTILRGRDIEGKGFHELEYKKGMKNCFE